MVITGSLLFVSILTMSIKGTVLSIAFRVDDFSFIAEINLVQFVSLFLKMLKFLHFTLIFFTENLIMFR